jgi:hypothetical protein
MCNFAKSTTPSIIYRLIEIAIPPRQKIIVEYPRTQSADKFKISFTSCIPVPGFAQAKDGRCLEAGVVFKAEFAGSIGGRPR